MIHCHVIERSNKDQELAVHDDTITLDETDRHRRRVSMKSDTGIEFLLELEAATLLLENDILRLNDGRGIRVIAKPEALYTVRGNDPVHLLNLTWHVGNRHLATQIHTDHFMIRHDPVIRTMLEELGATVTDITAGFNPLGGAYGDGHSHHSDDHHSNHGHKHASHTHGATDDDAHQADAHENAD